MERAYREGFCTRWVPEKLGREGVVGGHWAGRERAMTTQMREPRTGSVDCPECGHEMRRTDITREGDERVMHLECPSCGHRRKRALS